MIARVGFLTYIFQFFLVIYLLLALTTGLYAQVVLSGLKTEGLTAPIGIGKATPHFSWMLSSEQRNVKQSFYEIKVQQVNAGKKAASIWESGKTNGYVSSWVTYGGKPLSGNTRYSWQVRVWDTAGNVSPWSEQAFFHTGFFSKDDWKAKWITIGFPEDSTRPAQLYRKQFDLRKKPVSAMLFITAQGMYEASLNGERIGDGWLTPGWTSYNKRLQYQVYDVTKQMIAGKNALAVTLGNGWYRSPLGWVNNKDIYGKDLALLAQLHITYADGSQQVIATDETWKSNTGAIRFSEIYNGEIVDLRKQQEGWNKPVFDDSIWPGVISKEFDKKRLVATINEHVKTQEVFQPKRIFTSPKGETIIDFGQNLVGWVRIKINGKPGDSVFITHAEVLDKQGNMYYDNMREAKCLNVYISNGKGEASFHPHFTWQGFRYAAVKGYPGNLTADKVEAVALYSDMEETGGFSTSNTLINQLQHNIQWGQRGNFLDVPTDCPQRDERLGWTGDAQAFFNTAAFNYNVYPFFSKWLQDLESDQVNGAVPWVVPNVLNSDNVNSSGWSDVATIIPWNMYLAYGDTALLARQYGSMKAYVESIRSVAKNNLWNSGWHFGDWLFYRPHDDNDGRAAVTDKFLIAQCFYAHSAELLAKSARVIGKQEDAALYMRLTDTLKQAFQREYMTSEGRLVSSTQTAYVLALQFDMLPANLRQQAADRLAQNVESYGHISTGFLGTPYICHLLTKYGYHSLAVKLLLREKYPSWLYPVTMGATTIWERWDGMKPDSSFQTPGMNSFNHYAYGAIGDWLYRVVAGIDIDESAPGYRHININPHPVKELGKVQASLLTPLGKVSTIWQPGEGETIFEVVIPANATALIQIPASGIDKVREGGKALGEVFAAGSFELKEGRVFIKAGSGYYQFTIKD